MSLLPSEAAAGFHLQVSAESRCHGIKVSRNTNLQQCQVTVSRCHGVKASRSAMPLVLRVSHGLPPRLLSSRLLLPPSHRHLVRGRGPRGRWVARQA